MTNDRDALEYVVGLGQTKIEQVGNSFYSTNRLHRIQPPSPDKLTVNSLSGLIDYLKANFDFDTADNNVMVHVESPTKVVAMSAYVGDYDRNQYIGAEALLSDFKFNNFYSVEHFIINLQAAFIDNEDRQTILKVVGNVKDENVTTFGDDGISQKVIAKTGVATVGEVVVPNPVLLRPWRTFVEIDQPQSDFIFRMKDGPTCALFEADGGAWQLEAIKNIKEHLEAELADEISEGHIIIIA